MVVKKKSAFWAIGILVVAAGLIVILGRSWGQQGSNDTNEGLLLKGAEQVLSSEANASPSSADMEPAGQTVRLEAEDAELTGVNVGESASASGQKFVDGFDQAEDKLRFHIELPESGTYMITIRYKTFGGDKPNLLTLNEIALPEYTFADAGEWTDAVIGQFNLRKGANTFDIRKYWGWIAVDYLELTGGPGGPVTKVELTVSGDGAGSSDKAIIMSAKADNASQYRFLAREEAGEWVELNTYSMQHQLAWLPPNAGQYELKVQARGINSDAEFEAEISAAYTVLPEYRDKPLVNPLFGDGMVLQRDSDQTAIWGWAEPGHEVAVRIDGQHKETVTADDNGRWTAKTGQYSAGGPHEVSVSSGTEQVIFSNVLFGDVWLASGQSNMEFTLSGVLEAQNEISNATQSNIRYLRVPTTTSRVPLKMVGSDAKWQEISPATAGDVTAVGYFFARKMMEETDVPVGLLFSAVGGTKVETWMSYETLQDQPEYSAAADKVRNGSAIIEIFKSPTALYNGKIAPLVPYALKGVLWYQGEGNWGEQQYKKLLPAFMQDWRNAFNNDNLPFIIIQISAFGTVQNENNPVQNGAGLPVTREAQLITVQQDKQACLVVTTDLGDPLDIHPTNKQDVGLRSALCALGKWYGHPIEYSGPVYQSMEKIENEIILTFSHVGDGLMAGTKDGLKRVEQAPDGKLTGFAIAGDNNHFYPAEAVIKGDKIHVSSENVDNPVHVRYGWYDAPVINLYNKNGLPATPFRTDMNK